MLDENVRVLAIPQRAVDGDDPIGSAQRRAVRGSVSPCPTFHARASRFPKKRKGKITHSVRRRYRVTSLPGRFICAMALAERNQHQKLGTCESRKYMLMEVMRGASEAAAGRNVGGEVEKAQGRPRGARKKKRALMRGCDRELCSRAHAVLSPLLGGCEVVSCTDDAEFAALLEEGGPWDAVLLAPGPCRFAAAGNRIPGSTDATATW